MLNHSYSRNVSTANVGGTKSTSACTEEKEGERGGRKWVRLKQYSFLRSIQHFLRGTILLNRNFDPETRTLRKNIRSGAITEDTLEKDVEGMAEKLIAEDEKQRAQELVHDTIVLPMHHDTMLILFLGYLQYSPQATQLGSQKRDGEETCQVGEEDAGGNTHSDK